MTAQLADPSLAPGRFDLPWHAQIFTLTVALSKSGAFSWAQWVECFAQHIANAPQREGESSDDAYYRQWLSALEDIVDRHGLVAPPEIAKRKSEWRQAYLNTPHGSPVMLQNALCPPPAQPHSHDARRGPIAVSPSRRAP